MSRSESGAHCMSHVVVRRYGCDTLIHPLLKRQNEKLNSRIFGEAFPMWRTITIESRAC